MKDIYNIVTDMQNDRAIKARLDAMECSLGKACIICGESVELSEEEILRLHHGHSIPDKVCNECRNAILRLRGL